MRLMETAAAICIGTVASVLQDHTMSASSLPKFETHAEVPAVRAADATSAGATSAHDLDFRADAPVAGQLCIPSPLWTKDVEPAAYEIGCEEVEELLRGNITFAGRGNIREVHIASYNGRQVAVKPLIDTSPYGEHFHWLEVVTSDAVRGRPHIVDILGLCGSTVVTEVYSMTLKHIAGYAKEPLPIRQVVSMSLDAAIGLKALHEVADAPIVHFDVKIDQLFVDDDGNVSLADFNLAYFMGTKLDGSPCPFSRKQTEKTQSYIKAPESIANESMTEKVDIYRMGLIYAEVLSAGGNTPFVARMGDTLSFDPTWHQGYVQVIQDMLGVVEQRPSAAELVSRLQKIQQLLR